MIFVTNPNNPTGLIVSRNQVDAFMDRVPPLVLVVFDEAYHEYVEADEYPDSRRYIKEGRNVVMTRTFSKVYGLAGMRIGYGVAPKEIIAALLRTQPAFHCGSVAIAAARASLEDRDHFRRSREVNAEGKKFLYRCFEELGLRYLPSQANFILLINLPYDVEAINQAMLRRGVIIRPTSPFGLPQALRVTVGTREENERMITAFGQALEELDHSE
jgi:histidinol-phosphate aminotransferase